MSLAVKCCSTRGQLCQLRTFLSFFRQSDTVIRHIDLLTTEQTSGFVPRLLLLLPFKDWGPGIKPPCGLHVRCVERTRKRRRKDNTLEWGKLTGYEGRALDRI